MKAALKPLEGKYYGTIIEIIDGIYAGHAINVWISTGMAYGEFGLDPSIRELEHYSITQKQWDNNEQVGNWPIETPAYCEGEPGAPIMAREALGIFDSHFETRVSLEIAQGIIKLLESITDTRQKSI
jgi:hypothetical protein